MRTMRITPFPQLVEIRDIGALIESRLRSPFIEWPAQAAALFGYMAWPNDGDARMRWVSAHEDRDAHVIAGMLNGFKVQQQHWARTADIFHRVYALDAGKHQLSRGGASVGKAITTVAENANSKGTRPSILWEIWKATEDVAHLVTGAVLVSAEAQTRHRHAPYGLGLAELQPYRMVMLMPELVLALASTFQEFGLSYVPRGSNAPVLSPASVWRIPSDINVLPVGAPARTLSAPELAALNARRTA